MKRLLILAILLLWAPEVHAQGLSRLYSTKGQQEMASALTDASTFGWPRRDSTTRPTCDTSQLGAFIVYTTADPDEPQWCNGTDWTAVDSGGAGSGDITDVWGCSTGNCNALTAAAGDSLNATSADSTRPNKTGTALPGTCNEGETFQDTDLATASEFYVCTAANTWYGPMVATTGNTATATALAANPTNCSAGNYPLGIDANGNAEDCTADGGGGITAGTTTITGGTNTRIPFNDSGVYQEDSGITFTKATDKLIVAGPIQSGAGTSVSDLGLCVGNCTYGWFQSAGMRNILNGVTRDFVYASNTALTESSATPFVAVAVASGGVCGGVVEYTIQASDASDYQARSGSFQFAAVNKAGTETCTITRPDGGTTVNETTDAGAVSAGTLTNVFTCTTAAANQITLNANAVSSLTQTTLQAQWAVRTYGAGCSTITQQ